MNLKDKCGVSEERRECPCRDLHGHSVLGNQGKRDLMLKGKDYRKEIELDISGWPLHFFRKEQMESSPRCKSPSVISRPNTPQWLSVLGIKPKLQVLQQNLAPHPFTSLIPDLCCLHFSTQGLVYDNIPLVHESSGYVPSSLAPPPIPLSPGPDTQKTLDRREDPCPVHLGHPQPPLFPKRCSPFHASVHLTNT